MSGRFRDMVVAARAALAKGGIAEPAREAELIAGLAAGIARDRAAISMDEPLAPEAWPTLDRLLRDRLERRPLSHLLGYRDFFEHRFEIGQEVLDPRPETEVLVRAALAVPFARFLDLGTGSGAIAVSLLAARGSARAVATDLSEAALRRARSNARRIGVAERCGFLRSDWFGAVTGRFDLIVSNPPYIAAREMAGLAPELAFEPRLALTDEADGLSAHRAIAAGAAAHLCPGGWLMVEIGPTQGATVARMFRDAGLLEVAILPDLDGRDRVVCGKMPAN